MFLLVVAFVRYYYCIVYNNNNNIIIREPYLLFYFIHHCIALFPLLVASGRCSAPTMPIEARRMIYSFALMFSHLKEYIAFYYHHFFLCRAGEDWLKRRVLICSKLADYFFVNVQTTLATQDRVESTGTTVITKPEDIVLRVLELEREREREKELKLLL